MDIALQNKYDSIAESLATLGNSQQMLEKVRAAIEARKIKVKSELLNDSIKKEVSNKAKVYGQNEDTCADIVSEYNNTIKKVEQDFCNIYSAIANKKKQSEIDEINALACVGIYDKKIEKKKNEVGYKNWESAYNSKLEAAYSAREMGDFELYKAKMEEAKEIEKQSPIYSDLQARKIVIEEAKREKDMQKILYRQQSDLVIKRDTIYSDAEIKYKMSMIKYKAPNLLQKMFNFFSNRFNGKQRLDLAMQPVKDIIQYIKQSEDNFVQSASTMMDISMDTIRNGKNNFVDLVKKIPNVAIEKVNEIIKDFREKTKNPGINLQNNLALEK